MAIDIPPTASAAHCPLCLGTGITLHSRTRPTARGAVVRAVRSALCQVCDGTGQRPYDWFPQRRLDVDPSPDLAAPPAGEDGADHA
jgi:hypothetical protein